MHSGGMQGIKQNSLLGVVLLRSRIITATGRVTTGDDNSGSML